MVAVHDVASSTADDVRWLLGRLDAAGIDRRVLKVVPRWKGTDDLRRDEALAALLREQAARGSEIVLHGLTHALDEFPQGAWHQRWRVRLFAPRDAEFMGFGPDEMRRRLEAGLADLRAVGLDATGFCPPAWIAPRALDTEAAAVGLRYVVRVASVRDVALERSHRWPAIGYMGVSVAQERMYELQRETTIRSPRQPRVLRVYLHPQGARESAACGRTLRRLQRLGEARRPVTYAQALAEARP